MIEPLRFWVPGTPAPKGSPQVITKGRGGRPLPFPRVVADSPATVAWQKTVAITARYAMGHRDMIPAEVCIWLEVVFAMESPESRYGTGRNADVLKFGARLAPCVRPDGDKLLRTTLDGMNGIVFADDGQVVHGPPTKVYAPKGQPTGAVILVREFTVADERNATNFYLETVWNTQPGLRPRVVPQLEIGYGQE